MDSEIELKKALTKVNVRSGKGLRLRKVILSPFVCSVLAALGIFGGISVLFSGLVCLVIHAVIAGDQTFDRVGTVLLISAIPMIFAGSVFMDEIERENIDQ